MRVRILRQEDPSSMPYWQCFTADVSEDMSVAGLLDHINFNDDIKDENGDKTTRIGWECSCLQAVCGGCAMVINGRPALACDTFLRDLKGDEISIRPLSKFPVIHDLIVDRTSISENLKKTDMYIGTYQKQDIKNRKKKEREHEHQYTAAKCLKCGLCLEVCPNYTNGTDFFGAVFANDCYLVSARNKEKRRETKKAFGKHFAAGCSKSFSCMDVCPVSIPTLSSIAKMSR